MAETKTPNDVTAITRRVTDSEMSITERIGFTGDDKKVTVTTVEYAVSSDEEKQESRKKARSARDLVTEVLAVEDDPSVNPWTFRMWFIGISMSIFAGYAYHFRFRTDGY